MTWCGTKTLVSERGPNVKIARLYCQSWDCPRCAPQRRKRLMKECALGEPNKMVTLTVNPKHFDGPDDAARALVLAWRRAREALKRWHGHRFVEGMAVFERHKSGWPHLHILVRSAFIPQRWLAGYMRSRIGSPIVDVRKIRGRKHAIRYVGKYIAKAPTRFQGCKRYWRTKNYIPPKAAKQKSPYPWRLSLASLEDWLFRAGEIPSRNSHWPDDVAEVAAPP